MARELALIVGLNPGNVAGKEAELRQAVEQLKASDYSIREQVDLAAIAEQRSVYRSCVDALAGHLGKPTAVLVRQD